MKKNLCSLVLLILLPISVSTACSVTASEKISGDRCVDVGGYQLYARIFGKSSPVVIFDSGLGDELTVWSAVLPSVSKFARVVAYDRAGLGKSDPKPGKQPITSQNSVDSLKRLLQKEHIKPPYILVGHSLGGLNMQLFAQKYPNEVMGVVLVDSVSRNQSIHDPIPPKSAHYYREAISFDEDRTQVKNAAPFPPIPLIVLTATNHHQSERVEGLWLRWQHELKELSPKAMQIFAWGSGHYIQKQQPQLVVDAIYSVLQS